jgi:hypothetical protein
VDKVGPLSVRPSRVYSGQKIALSFNAGLSENPIRVYFGWFETGGFRDVQVWEGTGSRMLSIQLTSPRLPKDRLMEIRVECGNNTIRKPIWSNGDKISRDWKLENYAVFKRSYCCSNNVGKERLCEGVSYGESYDDKCKTVILAFTTPALSYSPDATVYVVDLSEYQNLIIRNINLSGLTYTKWSLEEVGYYGEERPVVYKYGNVVNDELIGLPDFWTPPALGYVGYMHLTLRC